MTLEELRQTEVRQGNEGSPREMQSIFLPKLQFCARGSSYHISSVED